MKKLVVALAASAVLAGCASNQTTKIDYSECKYPDSPTHDAPTWICDQPVDTVWIQGVGYAKKMAAGPGVMKDVAAAEARVQMAENFSADIQARLSRATNDSTVNGENTNSDTIEALTQEATAMTLTFSRIYRSQVSPSGGMYVLVGLNEAGYRENVNALLSKVPEGEDPELYRQFLMAEANAELDEMAERLNNNQ